MVVKDWNIAIEILGTEKATDFIKKRYPMPAVPIDAMMPVEKIWDMMRDLEDTHGSGADYYLKKFFVDSKGKKKTKLISSMEEIK